MYNALMYNFVEHFPAVNGSGVSMHNASKLLKVRVNMKFEWNLQQTTFIRLLQCITYPTKKIGKYKNVVRVDSSKICCLYFFKSSTDSVFNMNVSMLLWSWNQISSLKVKQSICLNWTKMLLNVVFKGARALRPKPESQKNKNQKAKYSYQKAE